MTDQERSHANALGREMDATSDAIERRKGNSRLVLKDGKIVKEGPRMFTQAEIDQLVAASVGAVLSKVNSIVLKHFYSVGMDDGRIPLALVRKEIRAIPHDQTALNRIVAERVLEEAKWWFEMVHCQKIGYGVRNFTNDRLAAAERAVEDAK